ncbi:MAG: hypothetical protein WDN24_01200 [Sphingomonas sp.]
MVEAGIERLAALVLIVTGLSHIAAPRTWARFFIQMRERGDVAGLLNAWVHIPLGLLIVAFHPVWSGRGLIVTLIGCALTLKGTLNFLWPRLALRSMAHVDEERAGRFRIAGVAGLLLGGLCAWVAWG